MWVWFALFPAAYYLPLLLHELSHLLIMKAGGAQITSFKPYWHRDASGTFWFGRVTCRWENPPRPESYKYSHVAPLAKASLMFAMWLDLGLTEWQPLLLFAFCEAVDWIWWWIGWWRPGKDAYKWKTRNQR